MADGTIEIIDGKARRRRWGMTEKLRVVAESREPGATVRAVAARCVSNLAAHMAAPCA